MTRVLALEPTTKDISQAREYGDLVYIFPEADASPSVWDTAAYTEAVQRRLEEINFTQDDFFLAAGAAVPLMVVMGLLSNIYPEFRLLFWHAYAQAYVPRSFKHKDYENATIC